MANLARKTMNGNRQQTIALIISMATVIGLAAYAGVTMRQNTQTYQILDQQQALNDRVISQMALLADRLDEQSQSIAIANEESNALREQLMSLSRYVSRSVAANDDDSPLAAIQLKLPPALLASGIYILDTEIVQNNSQISPYTLYHLAATARAMDREVKFQFGVARSGFFSWQLYFDYDNDGAVDTDMVREYISSVPFGSYFSDALDPERSQAIYDSFLVSSGEAEYIPPEQIEQQSSEVAQGMWSFVTDSSNQLANWIWSRSEPETRTGIQSPSSQ